MTAIAPLIRLRSRSSVLRLAAAERAESVLAHLPCDPTERQVCDALEGVPADVARLVRARLARSHP